ncbi:MAG: hypothetical protein FWF01_02250 [Alphaproteobacteria bacterium]|nr:hypothetical protein [Alphaproteobacteria bacterium]
MKNPLNIPPNPSPTDPKTSAAAAKTPAFAVDKKNMTPLIIAGVAGLFLGMIFGKATASCPQAQGLTGIVLNPDAQGNLQRCGTVARSVPCVLFIVNPYRRDVEARDFFGMVAEMTQTQKFLIETHNMRYADTLIRPGHIGMFYVPPLR